MLIYLFKRKLEAHENRFVWLEKLIVVPFVILKNRVWLISAAVMCLRFLFFGTDLFLLFTIVYSYIMEKLLFSFSFVSDTTSECDFEGWATGLAISTQKGNDFCVTLSLANTLFLFQHFFLCLAVLCCGGSLRDELLYLFTCLRVLPLWAGR